MSLINYTPPADGETADAADVVTPLNTIYNEFNGNIDNSNIKSGAAIATSKLADDAGITAAKIASDAVTATKIDWASTGADGGIWWEELGRTTLGSGGDTITVDSLPARKYIKVYIRVTSTGGATRILIRFNNDTGANYNYRISSNNGADSNNTSQGAMIVSASASDDKYAVVELINVAAQAKQGIFFSVNGTSRSDGVCGWSNTSNAVSRIDVVNDGAGDFATGSEVVVLGHN